MSQLMLIGNPKRRSGAKRRRSPAQKAATRRMLAANRARKNPVARKRRRTVRSAAAAPVVRRTARRTARRSFSRMSSGFRASGAVGMLKAGAIGGAGALAVDVAFGQAGRILPAGWVSPVNADGSTNWMYFAAKAGTAVALGMFGKKVIPAGLAAKMAEGSLTVLSYQIMRGALPATALGYYNPVPVMAAPRQALGAYVRPQGMGAYQALSRASNGMQSNGVNAARILASVK